MAGLVHVHRKLRIEADAACRGRIVKLAIDPKLGPWPNVLEEQALSPPWVCNDDVGLPALRLQFQRRAIACFTVDRLGFKVSEPSVYFLADSFVVELAHDANTLPRLCLDGTGGERQYIVTRCSKLGSEVLELSGKVLMNDQNFHCGDQLRCLLIIEKGRPVSKLWHCKLSAFFGSWLCRLWMKLLRASFPCEMRLPFRFAS